MREDQVGSLVAARLKGQAFKMAMSFTIERGGIKHVGATALNLVAVAPTFDPSTGNQLTPGEPAGVTTFIQSLIREYEIHDQDQQNEKL